MDKVDKVDVQWIRNCSGGRIQRVAVNEWLNVQMETGDEWCPSGVCKSQVPLPLFGCCVPQTRVLQIPMASSSQKTQSRI